jgi:mannosyltransferase
MSKLALLVADRPTWFASARSRFWALPDNKATVVLFVAVFVVGFLARLYGIGNMPFWLDEVTTVQRSSLPFWVMVNNSLSAHHLPSYFAITSALGHFSTSEVTLRMPSALFGAVSCSVLFLIGRTLGGWRAGLVAGLLLALSPLQVQYGQEARSYTFVILMMAVGLLGLVEIARDPRGASLPWRSPGAKLAPWVIYTLGTAGALQVLSTAFFWLISANLAAIAIAADKTIDRRRFILRWLVSQGLMLLVTLPWFYAMNIVTKGSMTNATNWVPRTTLHSFLSTLGSLYGMRISRLINFHLFPEAIPGLAAILLLFAIMGVATLRPGTGTRRDGDATATRSRTLMLVLVICAVVPPITILAISVVKPLWMPRYLLWSSVPFFIFVGLGINLLPGRHWRSGAAAALVILSAVSLAPYYKAETKPRWDIAALELGQMMSPGDLILVPDKSPIDMMNFFLGRQDDSLTAAAWTTDVFAAAKHLQEGGRVWAVYGYVGQADRTPNEAFEKVIRPLGTSYADIQAGELITLKLFDRPPQH